MEARRLVVRVLLLSSNSLFRNGLRRIVSHVAQVTTVDSVEEAKQLACAQVVDAVVIDQDDTVTWADGRLLPEILGQLLSVPGLKVIAVSLQCQTIQVYRHETVSTASVEDFLATILV